MRIANYSLTLACMPAHTFAPDNLLWYEHTVRIHIYTQQHHHQQQQKQWVYRAHAHMRNIFAFWKGMSIWIRSARARVVLMCASIVKLAWLLSMFLLLAGIRESTKQNEIDVWVTIKLVTDCIFPSRSLSLSLYFVICWNFIYIYRESIM